MLRQSARLLFRARDASILPSAAATSRFYHEAVVDHYNRPRNVGSFDKNDPNVGTGLVGAPACGDVMKLQMKFDSEGRIVDSCFKTFGCGSAIASSSVATEWVKGKKVDEVLGITNSEIAKHLSLPPVKLHCSMLAEDAIKAAVKDYKSKRMMSTGQKQEQQQQTPKQQQDQQQDQQQKSKDQKAEEQRQESLQHPGSSVAGPDPADVAGG